MKTIVKLILIVFVSVILVSTCAGYVASMSDPATTTYDASIDKVWASETGPATPPKAGGKLSVSQQEAMDSAQSYVDFGQFSKAKLIRQLSSGVVENYTKAEATYAATHIDVDYKQEALQAAELYLEIGGFSRATLIKQLTSSAGEEFTKEQAIYAADQVGL